MQARPLPPQRLVLLRRFCLPFLFPFPCHLSALSAGVNAGEVLWETVQFGHFEAHTNTEMEDVKLEECLADPVLRFDGSELRADESTWSDRSREEAYVHALSCCISGAIFDDEEALPNVPQNLIRDKCECLRRALLLGHTQGLTDEQTRVLHDKLLPDAMELSSVIVSSVERRMWLLPCLPEYRPENFEDFDKATASSELRDTNLVEEQLRLGTVREAVVQKASCTSRLVFHLLGGEAFCPSFMNAEDSANACIGVFVKLHLGGANIEPDELSWSSSVANVDAATGVVAWGGEEIVFDTHKQPQFAQVEVFCRDRASTTSKLEDKTLTPKRRLTLSSPRRKPNKPDVAREVLLGSAGMACTWTPESTPQMLDVRCSWDDADWLPLVNAEEDVGNKTARVHLTVQYIVRAVKPSPEHTDFGSAPTTELAAAETNTCTLFSMLVRGLLSRASNHEGDSYAGCDLAEDLSSGPASALRSAASPYGWLLTQFGKRFGVNKLVRRLYVLEGLLVMFQPTAQHLTGLHMCLQELQARHGYPS